MVPTRAEMAQWPEETQVLWDAACQRRNGVKVWSDAAVDRAMRKHNGRVADYETLTCSFDGFAGDENFNDLEAFDMRQKVVPIPPRQFGPWIDSLWRQEMEELGGINDITAGRVPWSGSVNVIRAPRPGDSVTINGVTFAVTPR